ncbi:response regulator transcription factor, partial [Cutibacterium acnes]|nr:response regulator transcription factor [Cutibacterium acnes]
MRVVLVDDQKLVRQGFRLILAVEPDITVVGEATNGAEGVDVVKETAPDVVLMDVQMPVMDGVAATAKIREFSDVKVVILTTFDRDDYL